MLFLLAYFFLLLLILLLLIFSASSGFDVCVQMSKTPSRAETFVVRSKYTARSVPTV